MYDVFLLALAAVAGFALARWWYQRLPWPDDYLSIKMHRGPYSGPLVGEIDKHRRLYDEWRWAWVSTASTNIEHTKWHERAHAALNDLCPAGISSPAHEETLADVIAYACVIARRLPLRQTHSHSECDDPGKQLLTLDEIWTCLHIAQHLTKSTRTE